MSRTGDGRRTGRTATSGFGVGRREGHDSSGFYDRFDRAPEDGHPAGAAAEPVCRDQIWAGDARDMDAHGHIADGSVALVATSPPYFAGKDYERDMGTDGVPGSWSEYLEMLHGVFAECARKLEPAGRIAVNVANLGRKPYRSLSAEVSSILSARLGLLLRGEIVWRKAAGASGNCAWGSYRSPANPVLRDVTERIVIACKGGFGRSKPPGRGEATITAEEFMAATLDVWDIPPESAKRIGHPAPFPVALPRRLIELYTWPGDLVLDPFMGSGSTAVAAAETGRSYVGFDADPGYAAMARQRAAAARP